jgi:hypothetical protein
MDIYIVEGLCPSPHERCRANFSLQKDIKISKTRYASKESLRLIGISMDTFQLLENIVHI